MVTVAPSRNAEPDGIGVPADRKPTALRPSSCSSIATDDATAALYTSGEGAKIYAKWFTQKIPPKGLNLNVPLGAELKNEFAKPSDSPDPDSYKAM